VAFVAAVVAGAEDCDPFPGMSESAAATGLVRMLRQGAAAAVDPHQHAARAAQLLITVAQVKPAALHIFVEALAAGGGATGGGADAALRRRLLRRLYLAYPNTLVRQPTPKGVSTSRVSPPGPLSISYGHVGCWKAEEAARGVGGGHAEDGGSTCSLDPVLHRAVTASCGVRADATTLLLARSLVDEDTSGGGGGGGFENAPAAARLAAAAGVAAGCVRSAAAAFLPAAALHHPAVVLRHVPLAAALLAGCWFPLHQGATSSVRNEAAGAVDASVRLMAALAASPSVHCDATGLPCDARARQLLLVTARVVAAGGPHSRNTTLQNVAARLAEVLQRWQLLDVACDETSDHNAAMLAALDALALAFPTLRSLAAVARQARAAAARRQHGNGGGMRWKQKQTLLDSLEGRGVELHSTLMSCVVACAAHV
jgi:hypothetical protein